MACSCPGGTGLHLTGDAAVYEPVDAHGRAVRPGKPAAKLLVTSVINRTLPLLRYELAIRSPSAQRNPDSWTGRRIADLPGRLEEVIMSHPRSRDDGDVQPSAGAVALRCRTRRPAGNVATTAESG